MKVVKHVPAPAPSHDKYDLVDLTAEQFKALTDVMSQTPGTKINYGLYMTLVHSEDFEVKEDL